MVVKAKAWKQGYNPSEVVMQEYIIGFSRIPSHNQVNANDNYMIVDVASNSALTYAQGTSGSPAAIPVNITHDNISGDIPTELFWKFEPVTGGYKIHPANDPSKCLYCTNSNTGVRVGNTNNTWSVDIRDGNSDYHGISNENGRYIGVYFSNDEPKDWRGYTSIGSNIRDTQMEFFVLGRVPAEIPENPVFETEQNRYYEYVDVELSCETQGASIYYTIDGSTPTAESILYDEPIHVTQSATINAIAINDIYTSEVISASYIITDTPITESPMISHESGFYDQRIEVSITSENGSAIYYTLDGSTPTTESPLYHEPIQISSSCTLKAIAVHPQKLDSWVVEENYTLPIFCYTLAAAYDRNPGDICAFPTVITFVFRSGNYIYVKDDKVGCELLVYDRNNVIQTQYTEGDVIAPLIGTISIYNGLTELIPMVDPGEPYRNDGPISPKFIAPGHDYVYDDNMSTLVRTSVNGGWEIGDDDKSIIIYDANRTFELTIRDQFNFGGIQSIPQGSIELIEVVGFVNKYNNEYRILPRTLEDITVSLNT